MNKAIFLDRDGTINVEKNYLYKIEDFEFLPGVVEGLKQLQNAGYLLIIITNQSGIARGYYTEENFFRLNNWMLRDLNNKGIRITHVYFCPHHPEATIERYKKDCNCRKPQLGLFIQACLDYNIDLTQSYAIGDKLRDCSISRCQIHKCYLIGDTEKKSILEDVRLGKYERICYAKDFISAVNDILHS